ncbi:adenylate/guanylate cyclase domain-containing protein [Glycomyces paridis]|uniref:Guanylate cyclase domain-containing protein n=1 Tax=Glycomyces paridis TaxID=2126555 RepID=A0A4S8PEE0_9ACTN|nr:adenylate/guanylate cyclase domain-containing protein [Glycomyces paridis]THV28753.1 hypothetical protein E9998_11680 [Glycomyces paridis]
MNDQSSPAERKTQDRNIVVLAFDIRRFSAFTDTERTRIATEFRDDIEGAFGDAALQEVWNDHEFCQNAGDGIVVGFPAVHLHPIVDGLPQPLQHRLRERHRQDDTPIRMRLGIAVGPVQGTDDPRVDVSPNQVIIDACRIGDSLPTRMLLENSDGQATYLAVAAMPAVITSYIAPEPKWLRASEFVRTSIDTADKNFHTEAYLHVPSPSGDLLRFGLTNLPATTVSEDPSFEPLEDLIANAPVDRPPAASDQGSVAGDIGGDLHDESVRIGSVGRDAIGNGSGNRVRVDNSSHDDHATDRSINRGNIFHGNVGAGDGGTVNVAGRDQHQFTKRPSAPEPGGRA